MRLWLGLIRGGICAVLDGAWKMEGMFLFEIVVCGWKLLSLNGRDH